MSDERRISIIKRFSLAEVGEGWDNCYISYTPLTTRDLLSLRDSNPEAMGEQKGVDYVLRVVREHTIGGRFMVIGDDGKPSETELLPVDIDLLPQDVLIDFFTQLSGASTDPKATPSAATATSGQ
jgi:hypothetical protein